MIITTKRPASMLVTDTLITTAAWIAFIYQFTKGVVFLLSDHPGVPSSIFGIALSPVISTVLVCVIVCIFNALLVYTWARLRTSPHGKAYGRSISQELSSDTLADHFSLSPVQLNKVQDSRVTVVYHSAAGGITHLDTGDLQLHEVDQPLPEPELRVA